MKKRYSSNKIHAFFSTFFYLIKNITAINFYLKYCLKTKSPLELKLPWIAFDAIKYLQKKLNIKDEVFEYGGGGSTLFFAERVKYVETVESDPNWIKLLEKQIINDKYNVKLNYIFYDPNDDNSFFSSEFSQGPLGKKWSVILIDNKEIAGYRARIHCFNFAEKCIKENGIIIIDDFWRYPELKENNQAKSITEFISIGPGRKGLTSTSIFHY